VKKKTYSAEHFLKVYSIGTKLRVLRAQKEMTLSQIAAETGLSTALISKLETNHMNPTLPTLAILCQVYGVGLGVFCRPCEALDFHYTELARESAWKKARDAQRISIECEDDGASPSSSRN
jgi:transcriptional regulator with XRE-family HTH domain